MVARFREMVPTVSPFCHPRSRKIPNFDRNDHFIRFQKIRIFWGITINPFLMNLGIKEPYLVYWLCFGLGWLSVILN